MKKTTCPQFKLKRFPSLLTSKCFTLDEPLKPQEPASDFIFEPYKELDLSLPECYYWSTDEVIKWLTEVVKLPQYTETFILNKIIGETLLFLNGSTLPKMNIKNFDHIKHICDHLKLLLKIDFAKFTDEISITPPLVLRHLALYYENKYKLDQENLSIEEFIKRYVYHYQKVVTKKHCPWNVIDPDYYLNVTKTLNGKIPIEKEKCLIINEDYKFDLSNKRLSTASLV